MTCDLAYTLLLEQVDKQAEADIHHAAVLRAAGADVTPGMFHEYRERFVAILVDGPPRERRDPLREALGLT